MEFAVSPKAFCSIEGYLAPPSAADALITLINQISNLDSYTFCLQFYVPFSFSLCPFLSSGELGNDFPDPMILHKKLTTYSEITQVRKCVYHVVLCYFLLASDADERK